MKFFKKIKFKDLKSSDKLKKILKKHKVVLVEDWFGNENLPNLVNDYLSKVGNVLSEQDEDLATGKKTGDKFINISYDPDYKNLYRSSSNSQPLHTDFSYIDINNNIQFLMCVSSASYGGATTFIDSKDLIKLMLFDGKDDLIDKLKLFDVGFKKCENRYKTTKILKEINGDYMLNYNYQPFLRYDNKELVVELVNEFKDYLDSKIERSGLLKEVLLKENDVVFFNDSLVLHGRNSYFAKEKGERTLIKGTLIL